MDAYEIWKLNEVLLLLKSCLYKYLEMTMSWALNKAN